MQAPSSSMKLKRHILALSIASASFLVPHFAAANAGYYERGEEGWWWYQEPPVVEEKEEEPKKEKPKEEAPVIVMEAPPAEKPKEPVEASPEGPPPLSAAWFRENLQTYMDKAIDDPSEENVEAYFLLQRVMMDKAQNFSDMSQRVVMGDPVLDEINRRSLDPSSSRLQETLSAQNREKALNKILERAGIAFFFTSDCQLCTNQARILQYLSARTSVEILPISIDGKAMSDGSYADTMVVDQGQAEELGVTEGPALFMMAPPDKWIPLAYGSITQEDVISRVLMAAVEEGIITEAEFKETRPINRTPSLADALPEEGGLPESPEDLIRYLRSLENK